jgi:PAS domain S-box-containing protein
MFQPSNLFFAAPLEGRQGLLDAIDDHLIRLKEKPQSVYYRSLERWTSEKIQFALPAWVKIAGLVAGTALFMSLAGGILLKRQVNARTRKLSEQNEQMTAINRALSRSEEQLRLIMENLVDLVAVIDLDGRRIYNSPSYSSILGDPEKLRGTVSFAEIHPDDADRVKQAFRDTVRTGVGRRLEYRLSGKNGQMRYIESQSNVIHDARGRAAQVLVVSRDVTERRQAEEAIRELNASLERRVAERTAELAVAGTARRPPIASNPPSCYHEPRNCAPP